MSKELPKYQCHKKVGALKIKTISPFGDGSLLITPEEEGYGPFQVEAKFVPKHDPAKPRVGWYFVQYEDGYQSFSPPEAFEDGYTRIP